MSSRRKRSRLHFSHYVEYISLGLVFFVLRLVPARSYARVAHAISLFWFYCIPFRKSVVLENLAIAFPEKDLSWRRHTARACVAHFVRMALEFSILGKGGPEAIGKMMTGIDGLEHFEAVGGSRAPYILVAAHMGNWELGISYLAAFKGVRMTVLAKPLHNPLVDRVVAETRAKRGYDVIYTRDNLTRIVRVIRDNHPLGFVADQDARKNGIFVPFFGRPASTFQGPALFAHRFNLPIIFAFCCRSEPDGRYRLKFSELLYPDPNADREAEIERLTLAHVRILEDYIRQYPEQYFWFHRRWKSQPKKKTSA